MEQIRCFECGKALPPGRSDKRYCDDICRARATRRRNRANAELEYEDSHKKLVRALKRNYNMLKKAIGEREEWTIDLYPLYLNGFQPQLHTSIEVLKNGRTRFYLFEIGWENLEDTQALVSVDLNKLELIQVVSHVETRFFKAPESED